MPVRRCATSILVTVSCQTGSSAARQRASLTAPADAVTHTASVTTSTRHRGHRDPRSPPQQRTPPHRSESRLYNAAPGQRGHCEMRRPPPLRPAAQTDASRYETSPRAALQPVERRVPQPSAAVAGPLTAGRPDGGVVRRFPGRRAGAGSSGAQRSRRASRDRRAPFKFSDRNEPAGRQPGRGTDESAVSPADGVGMGTSVQRTSTHGPPSVV